MDLFGFLLVETRGLVREFDGGKGHVHNVELIAQCFDHYAEAPANVSAEVQKKFA